MNEYDDLLASEGTKDEARTTLRASVIGALPTNPDQYAEAKRLARTTGVPAPVVERNMDEVKKQATLNEYDALIERAPVTASKFQNPEFAKVAHDERDQLAGLESLIASAPQPEIYGSVLTPTGRGIFSPTAQPQPAATQPALDPAKVQAEMLRRFGFKGASTIDRKIDGVLANETRAQLSPWDGKTQEFGYDAAARKGVAMVKLTWDFLADQLAGSLGMDQTETRRIMADTQRYMQGLGKDFDTELAMDLARKQGGDSVIGVLGALPGAIDATDNPFDVIGKFATEQLVASSIGAGVGSMAAAPLRRSAAAYIANQAAARSVGVALTGASASSTAVVLQSLGSNYQEGISTGLTPDEAGRRAWVKTLAEVPANALAGALVGLKIGPNQITNILAQTGVQAAAGGVGAASASVAVGEKIDPLEIALEIAGEGIGAAPDLVVSGALTPASIVSRKFQMEREAKVAAAKASADHLTRILQAAEASKTRARDPETFAQLVQDAAEASGTAPTEVFIDAQPLVDTLQKAGMTEAQIREALPSVAEQLGDEYAAGGSVAIPIGEAVAAFAGTGAEADLVRFARTTEDGYSVADSEQALAALDEMDADAQRIIAEQQDAEAWLQSAKVVEDTIFTQLDNAGRFSSDVNRTYATLLRNYYVTQADVMGITPEELYRQFPLTASGVAPTGQVLNQPEGGAAVEGVGADLNQSAYSYTDEELDFLVADGSLSPEQAASLKATAKFRGQNADARTASATGRTQQADARAGRAGEVAGRTVAGTAPRSGWEAATAVRGADGKPARIFRGSIDGAVTPDNFNPEQFGKASGYATSGLGVFFSTWHSDAQKYADNTGGRVGSFFLDIRNPRVITSDQLPEFDSVEQATEFREALRALGHDGIAIDYTEVSGPVQVVAFDPEQVILPGDEVLYQSGMGAQGPRLSAIHNLSAENLVFSDKMGGIAVPSIGVVTEDAGGVDGFGEITLIGTKDLADPRAEPVFSSDAYSARFPAPEYSKAKTKAVQPLVDAIRAIAKEFGDRSLVDETWDGLVNSANVSNVLDKWLSSPATIAMFLREQGIDVAPVKKMDGMQSYLSPEQLLALEPVLEQANSDFINGINDSEAETKLQDAVREAINAKHGELRPGLAKNLIAKLVPSASNLIDNDLRRVRAGDQVDTWETRTKTRELLAEKGLELKFKDWVEGKILPLVGEPFIKIGREKRPYTLPNIVEAMTDSKVKGKEKTMTYGAGMARAAASVQFNDFEEMRAAAKTAIADPAEYENAKKESEAALDAYRNAVVPYTTYTDWRGQPDTWEALDASMRAIAKWATGKKRDRASLRAALKRERFKVDSLPSDALDLGIAAGNALMNAPVPYFEAKPQRAVSLSEFAGAVIPANAAPEVRAILDKHGIPYREVAEGDNRQAAVRSFTRELNDQGNNVLFQPAYHGSPYRFDKFSLEHLGKGEGAQAYGWGLYFAGKREVADWYRAKLTSVDGGPVAMDYTSLIPRQRGASVADVLARLDREILVTRSNLESATENPGAFTPEYAEQLQSKLQQLEGQRQQVNANGQLYEVNIPEDDEFLLWEKPLSEQSDKVRAALDGLFSVEKNTEEGARSDEKWLLNFDGETFDAFKTKREAQVKIDSMTGGDLIKLRQDLALKNRQLSEKLNSLGIAGVKYLDGTSRGAGDGSYNYVIFDDAAIEIVNTFYQQQNGKAEARGSFNPTTLNIALLEKADLSTFLHEAGHFFFEMQATIAARPDAPARIVDDVNTLLKEVGFEGTAAEWLAQPLNTRRESHEKVAESFEQYLITGEAPTVELQGLFNQMRAWMLAVYKTLKQFFAVNKRAGMTAEVAGVFDRMLASDAAIAETKRVRAMSPLFKSAEEAGMDATEWAAYQDDAGQMDADARRDLDARQVRDMKWLRSARSKALKALQADASAKRREARIEARRRLLQEPVYRAMQFLRGKVEQVPVEKKAKGLDTRRDDLLTAIAKLGGLNKDLVVAEWGIDPKDFAKSPVFGKPILRSGKAGLSPDGMAEALAEVGYLQPKDGGRYALSDLEAMLDDSARGIQHYSLDADYDLIHGYKTLPVATDLGEQPFAAGRLSRPDLEARFANSDVDWQKLGVGRRGMIAEVGMDADAVANIVGFNTGEEMVKALLAAESLQDATEALTDQIMLERYGDITSPEGLQRAADAALANDAHAKLLATEYARLSKAVGSPRAVQMAAKEAAERMVDRQAVRLARPDKSTAAAARAGKAAEKAHAAGNLDEAAGFKRNQILNTAIARAQRELRAFVEKAQGDFANMFGKDDQRAKTRDMNLVNLARAALAQYGLAPEAGGMKALQYLDLVTQYDPALAENLKSMLAAMPEGKDFRDLTAGEFRTVTSLVRGMWEMSRGVKQITIDGKKVEIDAAADELVAAVLANNGGEQGTLPGYSGTTTTADDLRVGALGIKSMLTRVEQWADFMGPAFKRFIWQPVSEAVTRYRVRRNEMVKQYRDLLKAIEPDLTFHKIHAPELGLGGFTFNAGKSEVLHAILHSGNESNLRKLLLGRGWATVDEAGNLDTSRWDAFVKRMAAEGVITRADMDFVQGVWDLLETVKGDAQKAHRELYGYYFNEVTATPFVDPFGVERRGGYVPALADGLSSPDAMQKREQEELLHAGNSFMFPSTGKGFTQARVEYNRPLELDLRSIGSHLDKVTRFAYIEPAVRDVGKLLINKRVARALNGYDQTIISQMLNPWLQRAARQTVSAPGKNRWADKFFNGLRSRSGVVIMFANVVNTLQQLTGFSVAAIKVPAPALLRATYRMVTDPKRMSAEAAALSPWLAERMAGQSFEMQQEIKNILVNPNPVVKGNEFLKHNAYFMQQAMQNMMDPIIWWGAYDNAVANGANQRDAIRAGDEAVRTTQGTFAPEDVAAFESNTAFVRLFTQFYGYFNMLANTLGAEAKKAIRDMGYGAATPRLLFIWFAGLALPAVVAEIIARGLPDDEDDEDGDGTLDEWLALFFGSQGRTLAAMAPGIGQGVSLAVNLTDDKVYNDRLSISPGMSMAETTIRGGVNLLQGEVFDERLTKAEVRDTLTLIGMATGAPTGAIARSAGYLVDVGNGKADPENPVDYAIGLTTGR